VGVAKWSRLAVAEPRIRHCYGRAVSLPIHTGWPWRQRSKPRMAVARTTKCSPQSRPAWQCGAFLWLPRDLGVRPGHTWKTRTRLWEGSVGPYWTVPQTLYNHFRPCPRRTPHCSPMTLSSSQFLANSSSFTNARPSSAPLTCS
jgi:hypothetical protein